MPTVEGSKTTLGRGEEAINEGPVTSGAKATKEEPPDCVVDARVAVAEAGKAATEDMTKGDVVTTDEAMDNGISELALSPAKLLLVSRCILR